MESDLGKTKEWSLLFCETNRQHRPIGPEGYFQSPYLSRHKEVDSNRFINLSSKKTQTDFPLTLNLSFGSQTVVEVIGEEEG